MSLDTNFQKFRRHRSPRRRVGFPVLLLATAGLMVAASAASAVDLPSSPGTSSGESSSQGTSLTLIEANSAAHALVVVHQAIINNTVYDVDSQRNVSIINSGNYHQGILQFNTNAGEASNQVNIISLAFSRLSGITSLGASVHVQRVRSGNFLYASNNIRRVHIVGSFNNTTGIVSVNVNAGNLNNQVNALALAFSNGSGSHVVAMKDTSLGKVSGDGTTAKIEGEQKHEVKVEDSFKNFTGILKLNIATGDGNNMSITTNATISVRTIQ